MVYFEIYVSSLKYLVAHCRQCKFVTFGTAARHQTIYLVRMKMVYFEIYISLLKYFAVTYF